ncbi:flagellar assembly protein FliW [Desulfohalovibrio reitneri]|uniref:flagellar assembly protein FliW n=1 Tax=Desulfohalovibrio reitneri TaxID=1307759 RepID=UPI0006904B09|nr:flagellar assembly protein FliW [Desulfohalovibrio reitneri]
MAGKNEIVVRTRLGERTVERERVITFPKGLIGFERKRDFALLKIRDDSPFMLLQCLGDSKLGLVVTDPYAFLENYEIHIGDAEQRILRIDSLRQLAVLVTVSIPQGKPEETTLNLTGPVLINSASRIGLQVPQTDPRFPSHYRLPKEDLENAPGGDPDNI